jgi:hypothetical protein
MLAIEPSAIERRRRPVSSACALITSSAIGLFSAVYGIAAADKQPTAAPQEDASPANPGQIDPQDAKWIEALAHRDFDQSRNASYKRSGNMVLDGRGNVAFLNDDNDVIGLCTDLHSTINDAFLKEFLARFPKVNRLYLRGTPAITDDGLATLGKQTDLHKLIIVSPKVTDRGLEHLAKLNRLESLFVRSEMVTDQSIETIAQLSALKQLSLLDTQITDDGLQRLKQALPECYIHADKKK